MEKNNEVIERKIPHKISALRRGAAAVLAAALSAVMLSGCVFGDIASSVTAPEPCLDSAYTADCTITSLITPPSASEEPEECEFVICGKVCRMGGGFWQLDVISPDTMAGMTFVLSDNILTCKLGELSFDADCTKLPAQSPVMNLFGCLDSAALAAPTLSPCSEEGKWQFDGVYGDCGYTVITDGSGYPCSLVCEGLKMTVVFENFCVGEAVGSETQSESSAETTVTVTSEETSKASETAQTTASVSETTVPASESVSETTAAETSVSKITCPPSET
ncbi:MAG: hypothetical protein ACI4JJ_00175 [Huintestinicola sp.]